MKKIRFNHFKIIGIRRIDYWLKVGFGSGSGFGLKCRVRVGSDFWLKRSGFGSVSGFGFKSRVGFGYSTIRPEPDPLPSLFRL